MYQMMIAGLSSGVGKTTISMGLMAYFSKTMAVQPFKVGPDYIDPAFHSQITGRQCRNLDSYLMDDSTIRYLYNRQAIEADMTIIEGVMGLYDGAEIGSEIGTSAFLAKILDIPVILVVNGGKIAGTMGAIVKGVEAFDPSLKLKGIIFNQVNSQHHYELLKEAVETVTDIKACGYLPKKEELKMPERHLGLVPLSEQEAFNARMDRIGSTLAETIDMEQIMEICYTDTIVQPIEPESVKVVMDKNRLEKQRHQKQQSLRIGIARDEAFHFYYEDNLQCLQELGCQLIPWSPLKDGQLPPDLNGILIGGGFPEVFAKQLEANVRMRESIRQALEDGMSYIAECGGLMYLADTLTDLEGKTYDMVGFLKGSTTMTKRLQRFGYCQVTTSADTVYGKRGQIIAAHEFHHSSAEIKEATALEIRKIRKGTCIRSWECGYIKNNGIASYAHLHYYANPCMVWEWIQSMRDK